jgi:hypothetical protein
MTPAALQLLVRTLRQQEDGDADAEAAADAAPSDDDDEDVGSDASECTPPCDLLLPCAP